MSYLVLGLALFVLVHMVPLTPRLRAPIVARLGENRWRGIHSLAAAVGLGLIVWGFGEARWQGAPLWWEPIDRLRWATLIVELPVFPLIFASFVPGWIAARVGHPMVTGVLLWAFGHMLIVGSAPAVSLFAVFLVWTVYARLTLMASKPPRRPVPPFGRADAIAVLAGITVWAVTVWWSHLLLIGIAPLG